MTTHPERPLLNTSPRTLGIVSNVEPGRVWKISDLTYPGDDLRWHDVRLPWTERDQAAYLRTERNACRVQGGWGGSAEGLAFLPTLQPLLGVELIRGPRRDGIVFDLPDLVVLCLLNSGTSPFNPTRLQNLARLVINFRPSIGHASECHALRLLRVYDWRAEDLSAVRYPRSLSYLRIQGKRQEFTFTGIDSPGSLDVCWIDDMLPLSFDGIESQPNLRYLYVSAPAHRSSRVLDLAPLRGLTSLTWLNLHNCGRIKSLRPLLDLPSLVGVNLGACEVVDGDMTPLLELPPTVNVSFSEARYPSR